MTLRLADTEVPRIGLGTNRLTDTPEHAAFVREAVAAGIGHVDTAHLYTGGESEAAIGAAGLDGALVATKGGYHAGEGTPAILSAQIQESLRRLGTDSIALYYLHRVDPETPLEKSLATIAEHRDRGTIRHVGSVGGRHRADRARAGARFRSPPSRTTSTSPSASTRTWSTTARARGSSSSPSIPSREAPGRRAPRSPRDTGQPSARSRSPGCSSAHRSCCRSPAPCRSTTLKENLAALEIELTDDEFDALNRG